MKKYTKNELFKIYGTTDIDLINAGKEENERVILLDTISKEEYRKLYKDYKTIINGQHYILKVTENGTCLVPVILK